jgi:hypothetical protein
MKSYSPCAKANTRTGDGTTAGACDDNASPLMLLMLVLDLN